jgi:hypothetical protein
MHILILLNYYSILLNLGAREFSLLHSVHTGSGFHPASHKMGTKGSFSGSKAAGGVKLTVHFHLVPRSRIVELNLHSPICLHGVMLN